MGKMRQSQARADRRDLAVVVADVVPHVVADVASVAVEVGVVAAVAVAAAAGDRPDK